MVRADARWYLMAQWIADHGAVVVAIDNRGTERRDRAWSRAIKGSFGKIPLDDQVDGVQALGAKYPELDLSRVGVYGWSFGGYLSALAVLRRPDFFRAAVAGAPVVDWRDYDTHYTERYLDLPQANPGGYEESSLLTYAPKLDRPLLLVHGTADDNVYFFHSLKLADALFRAGRPFEFLPLSTTHQIADAAIRERLWQRTVDFLMAHLR
jgi:dipeptidyl-peptidase-4